MSMCATHPPIHFSSLPPFPLSLFLSTIYNNKSTRPLPLLKNNNYFYLPINYFYYNVSSIRHS